MHHDWSRGGKGERLVALIVAGDYLEPPPKIREEMFSRGHRPRLSSEEPLARRLLNGQESSAPSALDTSSASVQITNSAIGDISNLPKATPTGKKVAIGAAGPSGLRRLEISCRKAPGSRIRSPAHSRRSSRLRLLSSAAQADHSRADRFTLRAMALNLETDGRGRQDVLSTS